MSSGYVFQPIGWQQVPHCGQETVARAPPRTWKERIEFVALSPPASLSSCNASGANRRMRFEEVSLLVIIAAGLAVSVAWFRNPPGWVDVLRMIVMVAALLLLAVAMASVWPR